MVSIGLLLYEGPLYFVCYIHGSAALIFCMLYSWLYEVLAGQSSITSLYTSLWLPIPYTWSPPTPKFTASLAESAFGIRSELHHSCLTEFYIIPYSWKCCSYILYVISMTIWSLSPKPGLNKNFNFKPTEFWKFCEERCYNSNTQAVFSPFFNSYKSRRKNLLDNSRD